MKCIQQTLRTSDVQSVFLHENIGGNRQCYDLFNNFTIIIILLIIITILFI